MKGKLPRVTQDKVNKLAAILPLGVLSDEFMDICPTDMLPTLRSLKKKISAANETLRAKGYTIELEVATKDPVARQWKDLPRTP